MVRALEAIQLRNIQFKNRIVRSATLDNFGNLDGTVSERELELYETLASNNIGLIITGQTYVTPVGKVALEENAINDDRFINSHKKLVDTAHKAGAKIIPQLNHCGAKSSVEGLAVVAPSPIPATGYKVIPRELSLPEIEEIIEQFVQAAVRTKKAGYDGIQIHAAHSYLLSSFINPVFNKRNDEYGGSIENRFRMTEKIIKGINKELGKTYPVFMKINSNIEENDEVYYQDLIYIAQKCKELGVEAIEYSGYNYTPLGLKRLRNYYLERVSAIRKEVDIPAILIGGIRSFADMDRVLDSGIDMVSLARPFICEPDLITKLIAGQEEAKCTNCSQCFGLYNKEDRWCIFHDK